jgi:hypothetical protein
MCGYIWPFLGPKCADRRTRVAKSFEKNVRIEEQASKIRQIRHFFNKIFVVQNFSPKNVRTFDTSLPKFGFKNVRIGMLHAEFWPAQRADQIRHLGSSF